MSSSDSLYPFSSLIDLMDIQGGAQPPAKTFKNNPEEGYVRFVQIRDFETDAHLTYIQALPKWRYCTERDVLIARYGASVGRICRGVSGAYNVALAKVVPKDADLDFLYHLLRTRFFQDPLAAMSGRSAQAGFNKEDLAAIKVPHPSIDDQKKIVAALNCLDERIDLLREINATLEAIAQALFKSWFVDFDPVRAKMEGRAPEGMDEATAALFPDVFEKSALGLVPKGWRVGSFSDVCDISSGKRPLDRNDVASDLFSIPLYGGAGVMGYTSASLFDVPKIVTGRVGTLGKVHIAYPPFWASDNVLVVSPNENQSTFSFALHWLRSIDVLALNRGSTQPLLTQRDLGAQRGMIPSSHVVAEFEEVVAPLYQRIQEQEVQAQTLASLRDTLLPRLISGQLRLSAT